MTGTARGRSLAKDRAYDFVKDQVLHGVYRGGDLISEGDVAGELQVSRTPVREAFLRLESEGLLRLYPQRGALVIPVSSHEVQEVLEARRVVEEFAATKAIAHPARQRAALRDDLEESVVRQRALAAQGDLRGFMQEDRAFHATIVGAGGNSFFTQLYASLRDRQVRMIAESLISDPDRRENIFAEHAAIAAALGDGDLEAACAAVRDHLSSTRSALGLAP
jgi:DNA-binding GntR family transcriptional regulator